LIFWPLLKSKVGFWPNNLSNLQKILKIKIQCDENSQFWPKKVGFWPLLKMDLATSFWLYERV